MPKLKICDLSFCEAIAEKEVNIQGGLSVAEFTSVRSSPLFSIFAYELGNLNDVSNLPLEVEYVTSEDGNIIEKLENTSAGIFGFQITSPDGSSSIRALMGDDFAYATASNVQSLL